ncbi:hypothetical protein [Actinoplanes sp. NPDC049265]|uniref:hypothetical protein n=1 Tax=Actinoplanes sp. NPDC049265 TaxID=3363902 RepID=UPI00372061F9
MPDGEVERWLLEGDPAVRWRLLGEGRERIATDGWGARLLAAQSDDGNWGEGVYSPKWTSTTYTLLRLLWLGLPPGHPGALRGCARLWEWQKRWRTPETCIAAILVRLSCYHGYQGERIGDLVGHLLEQQQDDGGWNCAARGDRTRHGSFHTSVQVLEALREYDGPIDVAAAVRRGREFFLVHRLYRSHRSDAVAIRGSMRFPAFPEWHFDVLRGLEYFSDSGAGGRDERLEDAVQVIRRARRTDGRWPTYAPYPGRQWFELEPVGAAGRWSTVRALRVLRWWDSTDQT